MKLVGSQVKFSDGNGDRPAIFLAQFAEKVAPFNTLPAICHWASGLGFGGAQIPSWDKSMVDIEKAADSKSWCEDNVLAPMAQYGMKPTHFASHLQGQLMAQNPAHYGLLDFCGPKVLAGNPDDQYQWAQVEMKRVVDASVNCGLNVVFSFTGSFCFPYVYPWPPRPPALVQAGFLELARRWMPVLDHAKDKGVKIAYEVHPMEDVFDGVTFEMFLDACGGHEAVGIAYDPSHFILQVLKYLDFVDIYHDRIFGVHWKDGEFNPSGRQGVYSGYMPFLGRAGRFRSLGDGQLLLQALEKKLTKYGLSLWHVLEWEDVIKDKVLGATEGAKILQALIDGYVVPTFPKLEVPTATSFENFAATGGSRAIYERCLGFKITDEIAQKLGLAA
ncbi:MAG: sugar phosphate isomerase/epimerase [Candidatus Staskawiczbacteria bacterium]|jgi:sugar phosphate isomerase/epimerase